MKKLSLYIVIDKELFLELSNKSFVCMEDLDNYISLKKL